MGFFKRLDKLMKKPHDNWFTAMRDLIKFTIKCETSSQIGRINLIGGMIVTLFIFTCCFKNMIDKIINVFVPGFSDPIPLWIIVIFVLFLIVYFLTCVKFVCAYEANRNEDNQS